MKTRARLLPCSFSQLFSEAAFSAAMQDMLQMGLSKSLAIVYRFDVRFCCRCVCDSPGTFRPVFSFIILAGRRDDGRLVVTSANKQRAFCGTCALAMIDLAEFKDTLSLIHI